MSNKSEGTRFEIQLAEALSRHGYWTHCLTANQHGQPADVIAVKDTKAYLIDCKDCKSGTFPLSRIEENQALAMTLWESKGNGQGWFAIRINDRVFMIPYQILRFFQTERRTLDARLIASVGIPLDAWATVNEPIPI